MLADVTLPDRLLQCLDADAFAEVRANLHDDWRAEALRLLDDPRWRGQLVACAAIVLRGGDRELDAACWRALDGGSWVAPQLVATLFLHDPDFAPRVEERLLSVSRRSDKVIGALVRAYHRLEKLRMNVVAQLARHEPALRTQEGSIGITSVDEWLARLPLHCDAETQARWLRRPRAMP